MIGIELVETRFPWRGFFQDWIVASVIVTWYLVLAAMFSGASVSAGVFLVLIPQLVLSVALIPLLSRFVAGLDRFRLTRVRSLG
jgi:rod shape-determining protein MreD